MSTVKKAYTTRELVELLKLTRQAISYRSSSKCENWQSRPRVGRGGGYEWLLESMPDATRKAIAHAVTNAVAKKYDLTTVASEVFTVNTLVNIPDGKKKRATARGLAVQLAQDFSKTSGVAKYTAYEVFVAMYNSGKIDVPLWVKDLLPRISRPSLINWEKTLQKTGLAGLAGKHGKARIGKGVIDATPNMADYITAEMTEFMHVSAVSVLEGLEAIFPDQPLPTLRVLQRWMKNHREEKKQVFLKMQNPDGWSNKYLAATGSRSAGIERVNQLWEMDSSPTDIMLADGTRHTLIACIDVYSRRVLFHLVKNSNSEGVCALLRKALLTFGKPERIKMDNGADYASFQVSSVLHDLGIIQEFCTPFTPQEKPHVERVFKTFQHSFIPRLEGYVGHSVADRKKIESRKSFADRICKKKGEKPAIEARCTSEEFQRICNEWAKNIYGEKHHTSLGKSPNQMAAECDATIVYIENERALDMLLQPLAGNAGIRRVGKKGLRIEGGIFDSPYLGGLEGKDVQVRLDAENAGYAYVYDLDGLFICKVEDPDLTGVSRREMALGRKARQNAFLQAEVKEAKRKVRKHKPQETAALILEAKRKQAELKQAERDAAYSKKTATYMTEALEQAARAVVSRERAQATPETDAEKEGRAALIADLANLPFIEPETTLEDLTGREAFYVALKIEEKLHNKIAPTAEQLKWWNGYQQTSAYRANRSFYDDFGEEFFKGMKLAVSV